MAKIHGEAFKDMKQGIDLPGVYKTIGWDDNIDIEKLLNDIIIEGKSTDVLDVKLTVHGEIDIKVISKSMIGFERKFHYLSQPSRIRESSRSMLGTRKVMEKVNSLSVVESFIDFSGRMGVSSANAISVFKSLKVQIINEAEPWWIPHLRLNFPKPIKLFNIPIHESFGKIPACDAALLDYCSFILSRDFNSVIPALQKGHEYIIFTDATAFLYHINKNSYTKGYFTAPPLFEQYVAKFSDYLSENYGYNIVYSLKRSTICTHLFEKKQKKYNGVIEQFVDVCKNKEKGYEIYISTIDKKGYK